MIDPCQLGGAGPSAPPVVGACVREQHHVECGPGSGLLGSLAIKSVHPTPESHIWLSPEVPVFS